MVDTTHSKVLEASLVLLDLSEQTHPSSRVIYRGGLWLYQS